MPLKRVHLELARNHEFPEGSRDRGYDFVAPLDDAGNLVAEEWRKERKKCHVRRFWAGEKDEHGLLVHKRGGSWAFDYDSGSEDDDETGYKFNKHHFVPGEYVSIKDHDSEQQLTFRIVSVVPVK